MGKLRVKVAFQGAGYVNIEGCKRQIKHRPSLLRRKRRRTKQQKDLGLLSTKQIIAQCILWLGTHLWAAT